MCFQAMQLLQFILSVDLWSTSMLAPISTEISTTRSCVLSWSSQMMTVREVIYVFWNQAFDWSFFVVIWCYFLLPKSVTSTWISKAKELLSSSIQMVLERIGSVIEINGTIIFTWIERKLIRFRFQLCWYRYRHMIFNCSHLFSSVNSNHGAMEGLCVVPHLSSRSWLVCYED